MFLRLGVLLFHGRLAAEPNPAALVDGTDYTATFDGAPNCTLTLNFLTAGSGIGADQRLIVNYDATLDAGSQENAALTNIAGATEWFSLDVSDANNTTYARTYARAVTDGTVGTLDHEDAHTTTIFTPVFMFEKTAANVTTGDDPTTTAVPGDTIRYTLRIENVNGTSISNLSVVDELDSLHEAPYFQPGTLNVLTLPAGATDNSDPNGGASGSGLLDIGDLSTSGIGDVLTIEFEVDLAPVITNGTEVLNQSQMLYAGNPVAVSDDPNINGPADPNVAGDEDPTEIYIESAPLFDEFLIVVVRVFKHPQQQRFAAYQCRQSAGRDRLESQSKLCDAAVHIALDVVDPVDAAVVIVQHELQARIRYRADQAR